MNVFKLPNQAAGRITIGVTAVSLEDAVRTAGADPSYVIPFGANGVMLSCEDETVRIRYDGFAPTATNGEQLFGATLYFKKHIDLTKLQFIRDSGAGADAHINVTVVKSQDFDN